MIVVLIPYTGVPRVFSASRDELVAMVSDTSKTGSYVASLPPGVIASEFESAWIRLTLDLKDARYFYTVDEALRYYEASREGLNNVQRANILSALSGLANS
jgi:hypothetical protein